MLLLLLVYTANENGVQLFPINDSTYLSCSVDNLCGIVLPLVPNQFAKRILDGRVVALDKVAVDELDRERRLACGTQQR